MINSLTENERQLVGALVGLSRATEGNYDKLTDSTPRLMLKALGALVEKDGDILRLTDNVRAEKHRIVPDCSTCKSPCGRTFDYDLALLKNDDNSVVSLKDILLCLLTALAYFSRRADKDRYTICENTLYKALYFVGMHDAEPDYIIPVIFECAEEVDMAMAGCFDASGENIYTKMKNQEYVSVTGDLLDKAIENYYGAVALASQKGDMASFSLSWDNPLQVALAFVVGGMSLSCNVNMYNSDLCEMDKSVSLYFAENYKIISH